MDPFSGPSRNANVLTFEEMPSFPKSDDPSLEVDLMKRLEAGLELYPLGHPNRYESLHSLALMQPTCPVELNHTTATPGSNTSLFFKAMPSPSNAIFSARPNLSANSQASLLPDKKGLSLLALPAQMGHQTAALPRMVSSKVEPFALPREAASQKTLIESADLAWEFYNSQGQPEYLDKAVSLFREVLPLIPHEEPQYTHVSSSLSSALLVRFQRFGKRSDLEGAINNQREVTAIIRGGNGKPPIVLIHVLGACLVAMYEKFGPRVALDEAITLFREALESKTYPTFRWGALHGLGLALMNRFQLADRTQDLDDAIVCHKLALELPLQEQNESLSLHSLAGALMAWFCHRGKIQDLELSIYIYQQVAEKRSKRSYDRDLDGTLNSLGIAFLNRFQWYGQTEDLEKSVEKIQQALTIRQEGHPMRSQSLGNLSGALRLRYDVLGRTQDLNDAIEHARNALTLEVPGHPAHAMMLDSLATSLVLRFERFKKLTDLDEAIYLHREALALLPSRHIGRPMALSNLGLTLYTRFSKLREEGLDNLEESIGFFREDLCCRPGGDIGYNLSLRNLGNALLARYEQLKHKEDLEEAIKYLASAEAATPATRPHAAAAKRCLARAYVLHGEYDRAFDLLERAAAQTGSSARDQFKAATYWASVARDQRHESALRAYVRALALLDRCLVVTPMVELQQQFLAEYHGRIASQAASWAIEEGKLDVAVELLEQGRNLLWSKMRGYRHTVSKLREVNPGLAGQFEETSRELQALAMSTDTQSTALLSDQEKLSFDVKMTRNRELAKKWEETVANIRQVEGFSSFLRYTPFSELQLAASEGPVIIVNIDTHRNDAIIVFADHAPLLIPLSEALRDKISDAPTQLWNVGIGRSARLVFPEKNNPSATLTCILRMLWHEICKPVVAALTEMGVAPGSRIWWCPVGELSSLPLHAAGPYANGEKCLYDIFISSYTPTLNSLIAARIATEREQGPANLLAVGQSISDYPFQSLPQVITEFQNIREILSDHVQSFNDNEATTATVLPLLGNFPWLHLSCHGTLQADRPFESGFVLHGGRLSLRQIMQADLPHADLAFLAACQSAAGAPPTPDEALSLASAMQFCGFGAIVGTLWAMSDEDAPGLARRFYEHMVRRGLERVDVRESAEAVHLAVCSMREKKVPVERWCTFVHIGV